MKINFKKIGSILASGIMLASTIGFAAAASYPKPFVVSGAEDVAIVYGANAATTDAAASIDIQTNLNALVSTGEGSATTSGESINLETGSQKLYMNSSINAARSVLTDSELPTVLIDGTATDLAGTSYDYTQKITLGDSMITYSKSGESMDPVAMVAIGTSATDALYNYTLTLSKVLNVSDTTNVVGTATLSMQGVNYIIGANSDFNTLYLYGAGTTLSVDEGETKTATVDSVEHSVLLKGASSSTAATVIVDGIQKSVTKGSSYKFAGGFEIYVKDVFYTTKTGTLSNVDLLLGANTLHLETAQVVRSGADDTAISKTKATIGGTAGSGISSITIQQAAPKTKGDYLTEGGSYTDRVFGGLEVQFGGLNPSLDSSSRDNILLETDNSDGALITFTSDVTGIEYQMTYARDSDGVSDTVLNSIALVNEANNTIHVMEGANLSVDDWVIINAGDKGRILELTEIGSSTSSTDKTIFTDVINGDSFEFTTGMENNYSSLNIDGYTYYVLTEGGDTGANITWGSGSTYGDHGGLEGDSGVATLYPRIKLAGGEWLSFVITGNVTNGTTYSLPGNDLLSTYETGDLYASDSVTATQTAIGGYLDNANVEWWYINETNGVDDAAIMQNLTFKLAQGAVFNYTTGPLILISEEDTLVDSDGHQIAIPLTTEGTSPKMPAIGTPIFSDGTTLSSVTYSSDSSVSENVDVYGTKVTRDTDDNNIVTISYPDDEMEADILITEVGAVVTPGGTGEGGQVLVVKDNAVSSVSSKNLIVVGGSCINTVAANILGSDSPLCEADFTAETTVGAGEYIIKTVESPYDATQVAMLVAGYEAADTINAVAKLLETGADISSDKDTSQVYPIVTA